MKKRSMLFDIFNVALSNFIVILSGVAIGFLVPKIMEVEEYGFYKTFTLYISYAGFFELGVVEGIYLIIAGKMKEELNKEKMRLVFRLLIFIEVIIASIFLFVAFTFLDRTYCIIFASLGINIIFVNIIQYFQFVSQAIQRFKEYSIINIIKSVVTIGLVALLYVLYLTETLTEVKFYYIIALTVGVNALVSLLYIFLYRDYNFGHAIKMSEDKKFVKKIFAYGIPLLISNLVCSLLLTIDRQFVSILFTKEEYGIYAFAYNMIALITTATSAISAVLFPIMVKAKYEDIETEYPYLSSLVLMFVYGCLFAYFPLYLIVQYFLPKYFDSLVIFRIIFPALVAQSVISIVMQNHFKKINANMIYFYCSLIILALSIVGNIIAYAIFKSQAAISIASVIVSFLWYFIMEFYFVKRFKVKWIRNGIFLLSMAAVFYLSTMIPNIYISGAVYLVSFAAMSFAFYYKNIFKFLHAYFGKHPKEEKNEESNELEEKVEVAD